VNDAGSKVQLFGQAVIQRPAHKAPNGEMSKALEIRSDYLLLDDDRQALETDRPVVIAQGQDRFSAERMLALQKDGKLELDGRVRGTLVPPPKTPAGKDQ
jgi:lipopolysaccharide export system protein LptC